MASNKSTVEGKHCLIVMCFLPCCSRLLPNLDYHPIPLQIVWFYSITFFNGYQSSFPGGKTAGTWSWPLTSIQFRGQRMSGAIPQIFQYAFMAWCSVKTQRQIYLYLYYYYHYYYFIFIFVIIIIIIFIIISIVVVVLFLISLRFRYSSVLNETEWNYSIRCMCTPACSNRAKTDNHFKCNVFSATGNVIVNARSRWPLRSFVQHVIKQRSTNVIKF